MLWLILLYKSTVKLIREVSCGHRHWPYVDAGRPRNHACAHEARVGPVKG